MQISESSAKCCDESKNCQILQKAIVTRNHRALIPVGVQHSTTVALLPGLTIVRERRPSRCKRCQSECVIGFLLTTRFPSLLSLDIDRIANLAPVGDIAFRFFLMPFYA